MKLKFNVVDSVLHIEFTKPESGNSFGLSEARELAASKKSNRDVKGVLFYSCHPRIFCSGGDLKHHAVLKDKRTGLAEAKEIRTRLAAFAKWPVPKAAFVSGDCFGGGLELLSCFDFRIAAAHVLFGFWQRRIGLAFGWGGFERWKNIISENEIRSLAHLARVFGAAEALRVGAIHAIGSRKGALNWLTQTARWPSESHRLTEFEKLWWGPAHRAALKRFVR